MKNTGIRLIIAILLFLLLIGLACSAESTGSSTTSGSSTASSTSSTTSSGDSQLQGNFEILGNGQVKYSQPSGQDSSSPSAQQQNNNGQAASFGMSQGNGAISQKQISAAQEFGVQVKSDMAATQLSDARQQVLEAMQAQLSAQGKKDFENLKQYAENLRHTQQSSDSSKKLGSVEFDDKGTMTLKKGSDENKPFAKIPSGAELKDDNGKLRMKSNDGSKDSVFEVEGNKFTGVKKGGELTYENKQLTLTGGAEKVELTTKSSEGKTQEKKEFKSINEGSFKFDDSGNLESLKLLTSEQQKFDIGKSKAVYDPKGVGELGLDLKENKVTGKNADIAINDRKVTDSKQFNLGLDKSGNLEKISILGGNYNDPIFGPITSRNENKFLDIYYGDIKNNPDVKEGVSLPKDTEQYKVGLETGIKQDIPKIQLKGDVDVRFNDVRYQGSENAYSEVGYKNNNFNVNNPGEGVKINNGVNLVQVSQEGKVTLSRLGLTDQNFAESFGVKSGSNSYEFYKDSLIRVSSSNGKSFVVPSLDYEGSLDPKEFRTKIVERLEQNQDKLFGELKNYDLNKLTIEQKLQILQQITENAGYTRNYDSTIAQLRDYVTHPDLSDPRISDNVRLAMAELGKGKMAADRFSEVIMPEYRSNPAEQASEATSLMAEAQLNKDSLHYKLGNVDGKMSVIGWSPDGVRYLDPSVKTVPEDYPTEAYKGFNPPERNQKILDNLVSSEGSLDVLEKAARERGVGLERPPGLPTDMGRYSQGSEDFKTLEKDYNDVKGLYDDLARAASRSGNWDLYYESKLGSANAEQVYGDLTKAKTGYDEVIKESNNPEIQARAYAGNSFVQAQKGEVSEAIKSLDKAMELDSYNNKFQEMQDKLNSEYFLNRGELAAGKANNFWDMYMQRSSSGYTSTAGAAYSLFSDTFRELQRMDPENSRLLFDALQDKSNEAQIQRLGFQAVGAIDPNQQQRFLESDFNGRRQMLSDSLGLESSINEGELRSKGLGLTKDNLDWNYDSVMRRRYEYIYENYGLKEANSDRMLSVMSKASDKMDMDKGALDVIFHGDQNAIEKFASAHAGRTISYSDLSNLDKIDPGILKETIGEKIAGFFLTAENAALIIAPEAIASRAGGVYRFSAAMEESVALGRTLRLADQAAEGLKTISIVPGSGIPEYVRIGEIARTVPIQLRTELAASQSIAIAQGQKGIWELAQSSSLKAEALGTAPQGRWIMNADGTTAFLTTETRNTPLGFKSLEGWEQYRQAISTRVGQAQQSLGLTQNIDFGLQGSAATGVSSKTGRFVERPGDMDIVFVNDQLFDRVIARAESLAQQGNLLKTGSVQDQLSYVQAFRERGVALIHDSRLLPELPKSIFGRNEMVPGVKISQMVSRSNSEVVGKHTISLRP